MGHQRIIMTALTIFLSVSTSAFGRNKTWDRRSETPYTVTKTNDTGTILLSKTRTDQTPMILLAPHGRINQPAMKEVKAIISVDKEGIYVGKAIILSGDSKAYTIYPPPSVLVHLMTGDRATFILSKSLSQVEFAEFQFNLEGSEEILAPLIGRDL